MGILGQCLDEEASSRCVCMHTPLTHPWACMDRTVIQLSLFISALLVRPAHVITSGVPMWEEEGLQNLLQILLLCTLRLRHAVSQQMLAACSPAQLTPCPRLGSLGCLRASGCRLCSLPRVSEGTCLLLFQPLISLAVSCPCPPSGVPSRVLNAESSLRPKPPPTPPVTPC